MTIVDQLESLELQPAEGPAAAVYDRPIGLRLLYKDAGSGEEHYLIRYPRGLKGRLHRSDPLPTRIFRPENRCGTRLETETPACSSSSFTAHSMCRFLETEP